MRLIPYFIITLYLLLTLIREFECYFRRDNSAQREDIFYSSNESNYDAIKPIVKLDDSRSSDNTRIISMEDDNPTKMRSAPSSEDIEKVENLFDYNYLSEGPPLKPRLVEYFDNGRQINPVQYDFEQGGHNPHVVRGQYQAEPNEMFKNSEFGESDFVKYPNLEPNVEDKFYYVPHNQKGICQQENKILNNDVNNIKNMKFFENAASGEIYQMPYNSIVDLPNFQQNRINSEPILGNVRLFVNKNSGYGMERLSRVGNSQSVWLSKENAEVNSYHKLDKQEANPNIISGINSEQINDSVANVSHVQFPVRELSNNDEVKSAHNPISNSSLFQPPKEDSSDPKLKTEFFNRDLNQPAVKEFWSNSKSIVAEIPKNVNPNRKNMEKVLFLSPSLSVFPQDQQFQKNQFGLLPNRNVFINRQGFPDSIAMFPTSILKNPNLNQLQFNSKPHANLEFPNESALPNQSVQNHGQVSKGLVSEVEVSTNKQACNQGKAELSSNTIQQIISNQTKKINPIKLPSKNSSSENSKELVEHQINTNIDMENSQRVIKEENIPIHKPLFKNSLRKIFFRKLNGNSFGMRKDSLPSEEVGENNRFENSNYSPTETSNQVAIAQMKSRKHKHGSIDYLRRIPFKKRENIVLNKQLKRISREMMKSRGKKVYSFKTNIEDYSDNEYKAKVAKRKMPLRQEVYLTELSKNNKHSKEIESQPKADDVQKSYDQNNSNDSSVSNKKETENVESKPFGIKCKKKLSHLYTVKHENPLSHVKIHKGFNGEQNRAQISHTNQFKNQDVKHSDEWEAEELVETMTKWPGDLRKPERQDTRHVSTSRGMEELQEGDFELMDTDEVVTHWPVKLMNRGQKLRGNKLLAETSVGGFGEEADDTWREEDFPSYKRKSPVEKWEEKENLSGSKTGGNIVKWKRRNNVEQNTSRQRRKNGRKSPIFHQDKG